MYDNNKTEQKRNKMQNYLYYIVTFSIEMTKKQTKQIDYPFPPRKIVNQYTLCVSTTKELALDQENWFKSNTSTCWSRTKNLLKSNLLVKGCCWDRDQ